LLIIEEIDNGLHPARSGILVDMLKTLGKKRQIDIVVTTHNPALLDAAGNTMVPFITVVHRDDKTGASILTPLEEIDLLPKLMAGGSLGQLYTQGKIEKALKKTGSLVDEQSLSVKKQKRKPPVELKGKVTECGSIMSSAPLSEWGIEVP
jgi:predicted ATP-binding protein involved in virulence